MQDLDNLERALREIGLRYPDQAQAMLNEMVKVTRRIAISRTPKSLLNKPETKHMINRWKSNRVKRKGDTFIGEVRNKAPHAHLVEDGFESAGGFVEGQKVLALTLEELDEKVPSMIDDLIDDVLRRL